MSVTIETDLKELLDKINDKLDTLTREVAANQKETNAKIENLQREMNSKYESVQKELTDLKVDTATIKTKVESLENTQKSQVWVIIGGFISLVAALVSVLWRSVFKTT